MADCCTGLPMGYSRARAPPFASIVRTRTAAGRQGRRIDISWQSRVSWIPGLAHLRVSCNCIWRTVKPLRPARGTSRPAHRVVEKDARMLASLIVVFREVLEAGLIVGIVLAATQGVPQRGHWI